MNGSAVSRILEEGFKLIDKDEPKVHKLVRGNLAKFNNSHAKRMQELLEESKFKEVNALIKSARLSANYSDNLYSVRTNRAIVIKALSFWGPFKKDKENYGVKIIFTQINGKLTAGMNEEVIIDKFETFSEAFQEKLFYVPCPREVPVEMGKWFRIRFQLNGADTCVCSSISNHQCYLKECNTKFEFFDSSYQLPEIHFRVVE